MFIETTCYAHAHPVSIRHTFLVSIQMVQHYILFRTFKAISTLLFYLSEHLIHVITNTISPFENTVFIKRYIDVWIWMAAMAYTHKTHYHLSPLECYSNPHSFLEIIITFNINKVSFHLLTYNHTVIKKKLPMYLIPFQWYDAYSWKKRRKCKLEMPGRKNDVLKYTAYI